MNTNPSNRPVVKTSGRADLAFALMVMAAYFATFSSLQNASLTTITLMIGAGIAYVTIGIYGYAFCAQSKSVYVQLVYFLLQVPLGGWIIYMGKGAGFNALVLLPLAGQSVMLLPPRWMYGVNLFITTVYIAAVYTLTQTWAGIWPGLQIFAAGQIFILAFTQMAVNEEKARIEVEQLVSDLAAANQRLRQYALQVEELAISRERNRLAREIHDGLGHYLTTIHMQIQAGEAVMNSDPSRSRKALKTALNLTQDALADVRKSVAALHAPLEEDLPLPERLDKLLESCQGSSIEPQLKLLGSMRILPPQTELTLYRAVQEGLNNALKHAKASQLWITLDYTSQERVLLSVQDDGEGSQSADPSEDGFGLVGLRERANLLNGEIRFETGPGKGFFFEMILPG
jgi:signal transduction histidine kinase